MGRRHSSGFTMIELVLVIVIMGIVATVALRSAFFISDAARVEETKSRMDALAFAIAGNPDLQSQGVRSDFGYVGDVGAMPPDLAALYQNPGGYATWNGPYINPGVGQTGADFVKDAWGVAFSYSGGATITSTGSGSSIVRNIAVSIDGLARNRVSGNVYDRDGTPPGSDYQDSVAVRLQYPNGSGGVATRTAAPDRGGYFACDSIPMGSHDIEIIYEPAGDTLRQFVTVLPGGDAYCELRFADNLWRASYDLSYGLAAHWKLDEASGTTAANAAGGGHGGVLTNMDPANDWVTGKVGGALDFDGGNDCVLLGDSLELLGPLTVAAWVKPSTVASDMQIISDGYNGSATQWELKTTSASGRVSLRHWAPGAVGVQSVSSLIAGSWTHVVGVYDGSTWKIYWDGALDNSSADSGPIATNRDLYIGAVDINGNPGQFWHGAIDDVRVYSRALMLGEIQALYNLGS